MNHIALTALILGVGLVLTGCEKGGTSAAETAPEVSSPPAPPVPVVHPRRLTVVGIDASGSYTPMLEQGQRIAAQLVNQAAPGDQIIVRWISDRSYQSDQMAAHIRIPAAPASLPRPAVDEHNRFDQRARKLLALWQVQEQRRQQAFRAQLQALKAAEVERLQALAPAKAKSTDIFGFIAAAADVFRERGTPDVDKHLVLVTDLKDTVKRKITAPDLAGVQVAIWGILTDADPQAAQRLREHWQGYFLDQTHATAVELRSADILAR